MECLKLKNFLKKTCKTQARTSEKDSDSTGDNANHGQMGLYKIKKTILHRGGSREGSGKTV